MRGIREERLKEIAADSIPQVRFVVEALLARECNELNDWKPIDGNTPRDVVFLLYYPAEHVPFYDVTELRFTGMGDYKPTHYKELTPPKEQP